MFSKIQTPTSTKTYSAQLQALQEALQSADAVVLGAGAGLSTSAGFTYDGARFRQYFADFEAAYGFHDMYTGGFYPYDTLEAYWAWWSRHILVNRYEADVGKPYTDLLALVRNREYFVLTTNVDHQFQLAGFDKQRLFYTQGDYGLWQCAKACHAQTYDNQTQVQEMVKRQENLRIPTDLIPRCPRCGAPMTMNLRCDDSFVQDPGWYAAADRYQAFLHRQKNRRVLFLELGVGYNTPGIIKYPFWRMTADNSKATYVCINAQPAACPKEIQGQSICLVGDLGDALCHLATHSH